MNGLVLLLLFALPTSRIPDASRVDVIEHNTVQHGETVCLQQYIFWDFDFWTCCYVVVDWRMADKCGLINVDRGRYRLRWDEDRRRIAVEAPHYFVTVTRHDPEIDNREFLPCEFRRRVR